MSNSVPRITKGAKPLSEKVNDLFELLTNKADDTNEFASFQGLVTELNRGCDKIFSASGRLLQVTANFIGGEPNQNSISRGEAPHMEP